jgi:hypothetical protein
VAFSFALDCIGGISFYSEDVQASKESCPSVHFGSLPDLGYDDKPKIRGGWQMWLETVKILMFHQAPWIMENGQTCALMSHLYISCCFVAYILRSRLMVEGGGLVGNESD